MSGLPGADDFASISTLLTEIADEGFPRGLDWLVTMVDQMFAAARDADLSAAEAAAIVTWATLAAEPKGALADMPKGHAQLIRLAAVTHALRRLP